MNIQPEDPDPDEPGDLALVRDVLAIGLECAERLQEPYRSIAHGERGLPK